MNYNKFKGIFPALLTPFEKNGEVNVKSLERLIDYNLKKGVNGFYVGGSTGEGFLLSREERNSIYTAAARKAKGKCTLIAHIGDMSLENAVEYAKTAEKLGYDAISSVTPFYYKYTPRQIIDYYCEITKKCSLPMIIYFIPALAGASIDSGVFDSLLKNDEFMGVKFTSNDFFTLERLRNKYPDKILYNGYDEMCLSGLVMGADGAIGSTYNAMAEKFIDIYRLAEKNKYDEALKIQHDANDIIAALIDGGDAKASLKHVISKYIGIDMGLCKAPQSDVPESWKENFEKRFKGDFIAE